MNFKAEAKRKNTQLEIINLNGYGSLEPVDKALLGSNNNQSTVYDSSVSASEHN
ncbi:hypothetical protein BMETH_278_2 [methanotrophic bacterial endosymbiont of Bathymodiolus sp.]|nr:hypothetical protein BMETH_278_2 [methanotrophic bacterial endosymbiont of Bathymodiolus sp.]